MLITLNTISDETIRYEVEQLYNDYSRNCYYEALDITNNDENAWDVVQIVFEKLIIFLDSNTLKDIKYPKAFLITLAKHEAINLAKKADNSKTILVDTFEKYEKVTDDEPLMNVLNIDQAGIFLKKLEQIKSEYAEIIVLKCVKELTNKEIGILLDISPDNVKNRYYRAKKAYKKLIGGEIDER